MTQHATTLWRASAPEIVGAVAVIFLVACARPLPEATAPDVPRLRDVFRDDFLVGTAVAPRQFLERDSLAAAIVKAQFNAISPENVLKWEVVHPRPAYYDFSASDAYVDFGRRNGMFVLGHTLVWHSQTPRWVFEDEQGRPLTRDALLVRMREHVHTVVGRYRGRIDGWDVVNEALDEDGTLRKSPWLRIIGEDYIAQAFRFAHEADPRAELYYNDYSLERPEKRAGAVRVLRSLLTQGIPVKAVGIQGHHKLRCPTVSQEDSTISAFRALGLHVNISELDVDVLPSPARDCWADLSQAVPAREGLNPYQRELPDSVQQVLSARYAGMFGVYLKHRDVIDRVTFWGVADGDSWLNNWPVRGRTSYPLLFDRKGRLKPAFEAVLAAAHPPNDEAPRRDRTTLTQEDFTEGHFRSAYDAVEALRATWLHPRGPDSFQRPSRVWVYIDNVRLGDVETLRGIHPSMILSIRHFDANAATARWGVGHGAGVIYLTTFPAAQPMPSTPPDWGTAEIVAPVLRPLY
jgi:endo-1,4-beta-xylanase